MNRKSLHFLFLNVGHFYDHLFVLIFATVAAVTLAGEWNMSYGALIAYATPGFVAFGVCGLAAGWLADKWSREGMMVVFFVGLGLSSILTALAQTPLQIAAGLLAIGLFAAVYHPVGLALVVEGRVRTGMPLAVNGVFGNMGVAAAALITGFLVDVSGWRAAFVAPGVVAVATGLLYALFLRAAAQTAPDTAGQPAAKPVPPDRSHLTRLVVIVFLVTAVGGLLFQSGTFALPKVFEERLGGLAGSATLVGWYAFIVFTVAAMAQLVVGWLVDRHSIRVVFIGVVVLQVACFALMRGQTGLPALLVAIGFMLAVFGQIPIIDVLVGRIAASAWRSRLYAIRYIVTFTVMASSLPLIGWIHTGWGFDVLFVVLAAGASVSLAGVLMLPNSSAVTGRAAAATEPAE